MKRFSIFWPGIILILCLTATMPVGAATTLTVNCGTVLRGVTHCASGSLYGVTETLPSDIAGMVAPLKPFVFTNPARAGSGYQQPIGAAIPVAGRLQSTTGKVMIRLADIYPGWPYQFTNMTDFLNKVTAVINDKKASGYSNFYGYEIWNEPNLTWNSANGDFNSVLWRQTYNKIRSLDPGAPIVGPSYSEYNRNWFNTFLSYCKANNCLPEVICWHELGGGGGSEVVSRHLRDYRSLESSLGISPRKISINEYCDPNHALEGQPGSSARYIAKFERYNVDSACISWWFVPLPGRLGSLLTSGNAKGAGWYFYKWYGDMAGNMVSTTAPNDDSNQMDGFACVDGNTVTVLFGGPNDGTCVIKLNSLPSGIGSTANVLVQKVDWVNKDTASSGPVTISQSNYTVSGGSITVTVSGTNGSSGYRLYITPGSGGGNPTPTPGGGGTIVSSGHTYKLVNVNSGKVLGIINMSTADGANAIQWNDNGTADHNWVITLVNGYYRLKNVNSGKVLGITNMSTADGALALQWSDNGTPDHDWTMINTGSGVYKLVNRNSGKVLGIENMSTADGARALQWNDNGTADHLWTLILVN